MRDSKGRTKFRTLSLFEALSVLGRERLRMVEGRRTKRAEALRNPFEAVLRAVVEGGSCSGLLSDENGGARTLGGGQTCVVVGRSGGRVFGRTRVSPSVG